MSIDHTSTTSYKTIAN